MTQARKLIHNMEEAAQKMMDYIMKAENEQNIIELIAKVSDDYKKPFESYVWSPIYYLFGWRVRTSQVDELVAVVKDEHVNARQLLTSIVRFMETGGWESTSANTNLMYEILARLPAYKVTDPNPRASLTLSEIFELHQVFAAKAKGIIHAVKGDLTQKDGVSAELGSIPKRDIREVGKHLPASSNYKKKEWLPANKSIKSNYRDIMETLAVLYTSRQEGLPVTRSGKTGRQGQAVAVEPTVVNDSLIADVLEHPYAEAPFIIPTPPPPPQLSAGAFAVTEKVVKGRQEKYSAEPNKLNVSEAMMTMAKTMFMPRPPAEIIVGTCDDSIVSKIGF